MSILYISHDLPSVAGICQRIAIPARRRDRRVRNGGTDFYSARHEYTRRLMQALPQLPVQREVLLARAQHAVTLD